MMPYLLQTFQSRVGLRGLVVDQAIHCGVCRPKPEPSASSSSRTDGADELGLGLACIASRYRLLIL